MIFVAHSSGTISTKKSYGFRPDQFNCLFLGSGGSAFGKIKLIDGCGLGRMEPDHGAAEDNNRL